jgi:hypothetical protein
MLNNWTEQRDKEICDLYKSGYSCQEIYNKHIFLNYRGKRLSVRSMQRILKKNKLIRSQRDSFVLAIKKGRMTYDHLKIDEKTRSKRKTINPAQRYRILERDGFACCLCGRTKQDGVKLQIDHIIPVYKGGKTIDKNLQTLCMDCNVGKYQQHSVNKGKKNINISKFT